MTLTYKRQEIKWLKSFVVADPQNPLKSYRPAFETRNHLINGEGGIRTLGKLPYTAFPVLRLQPLGHLSKGALLS